MNRSEHLRWCKDRALKYVETGDIPRAVTSMITDLAKHPETRGHPAIMLAGGLLFSGKLITPEEARNFIEGFN